MRPRQSSLGIHQGALQAELRRGRSIRCFNEAEAIKPRNPAAHRLCGWHQLRRPSYRFNEAEAIKPRNPTCELGLSTGMRISRFNEAEAIKPRNPGLVTDFATGS